MSWVTQTHQAGRMFETPETSMIKAVKNKTIDVYFNIIHNRNC